MNTAWATPMRHLMQAGDAHPPSTATGPSLAAAQPTRGHATGKAIAKSAASHLAAEWVCIYDDLFSMDTTWPDSKACYDYFRSL